MKKMKKTARSTLSVQQLHKQHLKQLLSLENGENSWGSPEYTRAILENKRFGIVAFAEKKLVGALIYSKPKDFEGFHIERIVCLDKFAKEDDIRSSLVEQIKEFATESAGRKYVQAQISGSDLKTIEWFERHGWLRKRDEASDLYIYSPKS